MQKKFFEVLRHPINKYIVNVQSETAADWPSDAAPASGACRVREAGRLWDTPTVGRRGPPV